MSISRSARRPKVFICYIASDHEIANQLYDELLNAGADPWLDKRKLVLGDDWEKEIEEAVKTSDAFVACLRPKFNDPGFRQAEVNQALNALKRRAPRSGFIIPYIVEPCDLPEWCKPLHAGSHGAQPSTFRDLQMAINKHCNVGLELPVREIKYILAPEHYSRLRAYLSNTENEFRIARQSNFYYHDRTGVIQSQWALVRVRIESIEHAEFHRNHAELTIKARHRSHDDGTVLRIESSYDITEIVADVLPEIATTRPLALTDTSAFGKEFDCSRRLRSHLSYLWNLLEAEFLLEGVKSLEELEFTFPKEMTNTRLTATTQFGLVLELDEFSTKAGQYYELEIETMEAEEPDRDEFVHLLFATLDIPIVCPTRQLGHYPAKMALALRDECVIVLDPQYENGKVNAERLIRQSHRESCETCRSWFG